MKFTQQTTLYSRISEIRKIIKPVVSSLLIFSASSVIQAETTVEWVDRTLDLQEGIDLEAPLSQITFVGTHNSYNAKGDGYNVDPNQSWSLQKQLEKNVREIVFDVYHIPGYLMYKSEGELFLCHGVCALNSVTGEVYDRKFSSGLSDISAFVGGSGDEVVLLKMELNINDKEGKFLGQLLSYLGEDLIFTWDDYVSVTGISSQQTAAGCRTFNAYKISKQDILNQGKKVIILTDECFSSNPNWMNLVFSGVRKYDGHGHSEGESNGINKHKLEKASSVEGVCSIDTALAQREMIRVFDPNTMYGIGDGLDDKETKLETSLLPDYLACGLNIFEMVDIDEEKREKMVWSWDEFYPVRSTSSSTSTTTVGGIPQITITATVDEKPCAALKGNTKRFRNQPESNQHQFACRKAGDSSNGFEPIWAITTGSSNFQQGSATCSSEFGSDYRFAVPRNGQEMKTLTDLMDSQSTGTIWVNYAKRKPNGTLSEQVESGVVGEYNFGIWTADIGEDTAL